MVLISAGYMNRPCLTLVRLPNRSQLQDLVLIYAGHMNSPTLVRLPKFVEEMICSTDFCRLYEQALFDPSQAAKQKPAVRAGKLPATAVQTSAPSAKPGTAKPGTEVKSAVPKAAPAHLAELLHDVPASTGNKEATVTEPPAQRREVKDHARREAAAKERAPARGVSETVRPPRDTGTVKAVREVGTRGGREHTDKTTAREGRHASAATAKPDGATANRKADDLAAARAAALERKQSANGDVVAKDAPEQRTSPSKADKGMREVDGDKGGDANGVMSAAGTKRRAADVPRPLDLK